jgi:hypothetical protein
MKNAPQRTTIKTMSEASGAGALCPPNDQRPKAMLKTLRTVRDPGSHHWIATSNSLCPWRRGALAVADGERDRGHRPNEREEDDQAAAERRDVFTEGLDGGEAPEGEQRRRDDDEPEPEVRLVVHLLADLLDPDALLRPAPLPPRLGRRGLLSSEPNSQSRLYKVKPMRTSEPKSISMPAHISAGMSAGHGPKK